MGYIGELFEGNTAVDTYMKRFKVVQAHSLFEPSKEDIVNALKKKLCPLCGRKLYPSRDGLIYRCKSKRRDKFIVRAEVLNKYG